MQRIVLYPLKQPAIIVKAMTGLTYINQTCGVSCNHREQEGFLVPITPLPKKYTIFDPDRWYKEMPALNDALYDEIEGTLNRKFAFHWHLHDLRVNRAALNEEAWVHVRFRGDFKGGGTFRSDVNRDPQYNQFPKYEGILTWENCD